MLTILFPSTAVSLSFFTVTSYKGNKPYYTMKKILNILLVALSAFIFSSCGENPKDQLVDESIEIMEKTAAAMKEGDAAKLMELMKEGKELKKKAEELGVDLKDEDSLSDDQKERLKAAKDKLLNTATDIGSGK